METFSLYLKKNQIYFLIFFASVLLFVFLKSYVPVRIGDGAEYYAMYFAWFKTYLPFMSGNSWSSFSKFIDANEVLGINELNFYLSQFPSLHKNNTADFNHFWFYSFTSAIISLILSLVKIKISAHTSFILLHVLLLLTSYFLVNKYYSFLGIISLTILVFCSPIFWFINKVHTEFFTFCFVFCANLFILKNRYLLAALFLAIVSTQNISFGLISIFCIGLYIYNTSSIIESIKGKFHLIVLILIIISLHPLYYYCRFNVITPQLLAGGAEIGGNQRFFLIWLFDLDLGLFAYWPLGLISICLYFLSKKMSIVSRSWNIYLIIYLLISLYAQSSTTNLNAGGTNGISRYATWYIPMFFPYIYMV